MDKIVLPKKYLSWSQINLWNRSPAQYRRQYYMKEGFIDTTEIRFGKSIGEQLEQGEKLSPPLDTVRRYRSMEYEMKTEVEGIPIIGFADSYDPETHSFREYKTGHTPWDAVRVRKHDQLVLYSLLIETITGHVNDLCFLDWLPTRKVPRTVEFDGHVLEGGKGYDIELTGELHTFERIIKDWERARMVELVQKTAIEISTDFSQWALDNPSEKD